MEEEQVQARRSMVEDQIMARGVRDPRVLKAMTKVERHRFVEEPWKLLAYGDRPLPIGHGQTISQPYIVALMTETVRVRPQDRVLEIGTGSGYQAAILAELAKEVYSIEIVKPLAEKAAERLTGLGYKNVYVRHGDGYAGWPEHAPFDAIVVTAAPAKIPKKLVDQLAPGGRLVLPVGGEGADQELILIEKTEQGLVRKSIAPVHFVPMVSE